MVHLKVKLEKLHPVTMTKKMVVNIDVGRATPTEISFDQLENL